MKKNSLAKFVKEISVDIDKFEKAYQKKHEENPEHYPLELPADNVGLWLEFFVDYHTHGTV